MGLLDPPALTKSLGDKRYSLASRSPLMAKLAGLTTSTATVSVDQIGAPISLALSASSGQTFTSVSQVCGAIPLPNGNFLVAFRGTSTSSLGYGQVYTMVMSLTAGGTGGPTLTPVVGATLAASDPILDVRASTLFNMSDGRVLMVLGSNPTTSDPWGINNGSASGGTTQIAVTVSSRSAAAVTVTSGNDWAGNPVYGYVAPGMFVTPDPTNGIPAGTTVLSRTSNVITLSVSPSSTPSTMGFYAVNPDGGTGNVRYMIGTVSGNTVTWGSQLTLPTGFSVSAGFDYATGTPPIEPSPGSIIVPIVGSQTTRDWATADQVGWVVGTYTPGGSISWGSFVAGPSALSGFALNENSVVIDHAGTWHMTARSNLGVNGSTGANEVFHYTASTTPTGPSYSNGVWNAGSVVSVGSFLPFTQPSLTVLSSGTIVFPGRIFLSRLGASGTPGQPGVIMSSADNGATWQGQAMGESVTTIDIGTYEYGAIVEVPSQPGLAIVFYAATQSATSNNCQILARFLVDGAAMTPSGSVGAVGFFGQYVRAAVVEGEQLLVGPYGPNLNGGVATPNWTFPSIWKRLASPVSPSTIKSYPEYTSGHPLAEYQDLRTDIDMVFQNFSREEIHDDSGGSFLSSGTMYLTRFWPEWREFNPRYLLMECGNTAQPSGGHAWAVILQGPQTVLTKIQITADVTAGFTANSSIKLDFGAAFNWSDQVNKYLGIVFTGTPPSLLGRTVWPQATLRTPILCGNDSGGTVNTGPSGFVVPTAPTTGGAFEPWFGLSAT